MTPLNYGFYVVSALSVVGLFIATKVMLGDAWYWFFFCGIVGIATGIAFVYITQYYTAGSWRPVQEIAEASKTGPATNIIIGTAVGFETTALTAIAIGLALIGSFALGSQADISPAIPAFTTGIFGTAVATMGMLMSAAYILSMDTFGPITDNAGGITEMSGAPEGAREITDKLDAVGNTTKALTKGYAVASAGLAAFLLFSAYLDKVKERLEIPLTAELPDRPLEGRRVRRRAARRRCWSSCSARWPSAPSETRPAPSSRKSGGSSARIPASWPERRGPTTRRLWTSRRRAALREMVLPGILAVGHAGRRGHHLPLHPPR